MISLPDKASDLLELAMANLEECEADDRYIIEMDVWHAPGGNGGCCGVCLAGAVMAMTLHARDDHNLMPHNFGNDATEKKLRALEKLRIGEIADALDLLEEVHCYNHSDYFAVTKYIDGSENFKACMYALIAQLRKEDL